MWPPAPYCLGRCQYYVTGRDRSHGLPTLSRVWQRVKLSDVSLATRPQYSLVVDEDVKKRTNQPTNSIRFYLKLTRNDTPYSNVTEIVFAVSFFFCLFNNLTSLLLVQDNERLVHQAGEGQDK